LEKSIISYPAVCNFTFFPLKKQTVMSSECTWASITWCKQKRLQNRFTL